MYNWMDHDLIQIKHGDKIKIIILSLISILLFI